jgi:hypothetical protein
VVKQKEIANWIVSFIVICLARFSKHYWCGKVKEDEMGGEYSTHRIYEKCVHNLVGKSKGRSRGKTLTQMGQ